jgi:putative Ca2+/H+ antiporter (TMEM165/GDT1 family)
MDLITIYLSTFLIVFIGELGDKTQIAAGTGALANRKDTRIIFLSSALALVSVAALTVFFAGLIPPEFVPTITKVGGAMLIAYGIYLYLDSGSDDEEDSSEKSGWILFFSHFSVVFVAELGDKTQIATLAVAIENQSYLFLVFSASASALVTVTAITVWGVTKIPNEMVQNIQKAGAVLMSIYGAYMIIS